MSTALLLLKQCRASRLLSLPRCTLSTIPDIPLAYRPAETGNADDSNNSNNNNNNSNSNNNNKRRQPQTYKGGSRHQQQQSSKDYNNNNNNKAYNNSSFNKSDNNFNNNSSGFDDFAHFFPQHLTRNQHSILSQSKATEANLYRLYCEAIEATNDYYYLTESIQIHRERQQQQKQQSGGRHKKQQKQRQFPPQVKAAIKAYRQNTKVDNRKVSSMVNQKIMLPQYLGEGLQFALYDCIYFGGADIGTGSIDQEYNNDTNNNDSHSIEDESQADTNISNNNLDHVPLVALQTLLQTEDIVIKLTEDLNNMVKLSLQIMDNWSKVPNHNVNIRDSKPFIQAIKSEKDEPTNNRYYQIYQEVYQTVQYRSAKAYNSLVHTCLVQLFVLQTSRQQMVDKLIQEKQKEIESMAAAAAAATVDDKTTSTSGAGTFTNMVTSIFSKSPEPKSENENELARILQATQTMAHASDTAQWPTRNMVVRAMQHVESFAPFTESSKPDGDNNSSNALLVTQGYRVAADQLLSLLKYVPSEMIVPEMIEVLLNTLEKSANLSSARQCLKLRNMFKDKVLIRFSLVLEAYLQACKQSSSKSTNVANEALSELKKYREDNPSHHIDERIFHASVVVHCFSYLDKQEAKGSLQLVEDLVEDVLGKDGFKDLLSDIESGKAVKASANMYALLNYLACFYTKTGDTDRLSEAFAIVQYLSKFEFETETKCLDINTVEALVHVLLQGTVGKPAAKKSEEYESMSKVIARLVYSLPDGKNGLSNKCYSNMFSLLLASNVDHFGKEANHLLSLMQLQSSLEGDGYSRNEFNSSDIVNINLSHYHAALKCHYSDAMKKVPRRAAKQALCTLESLKVRSQPLVLSLSQVRTVEYKDLYDLNVTPVYKTYNLVLRTCAATQVEEEWAEAAQIAGRVIVYMLEDKIDIDNAAIENARTCFSRLDDSSEERQNLQELVTLVETSAQSIKLRL